MDGESEATRATTASFSISHVLRTDMREPSETSLILKMEMKQLGAEEKFAQELRFPETREEAQYIQRLPFGGPLL